MSETEEGPYQPKRSSDFTKTDSTSYTGKRRSTDPAPGGLFHDPFSAYKEENGFDPVAKDGSAFEGKVGRREAIIESVYSNEVDGKTFTIPTAKRSPKLLIGLIAGALAVTGAAVAAVFIFGTPDGPVEETSGPTLGPIFAEAFPDRSPLTASERVVSTNNGFEASEGSALATSSYVTVGAEADCSVQRPQDFCLAGTVELPTLTSRVFYASDLGSTPLFQSAYEVNELSVNNGNLKASVVSDLNGTPTRFIVFMDGRQGDGWFMEVPLNQKLEDSKRLAEDFTHTA